MNHLKDSNIDARELARILSAGEARGVRDIALELEISESAVLDQAGILTRLGLELEVGSSLEGDTLRARRLDLLDAGTIIRELADAPVDELEVCWSIDSTNARLLDSAPPPPDRASVCVAEFQTTGRGRRGRDWVAPLGSGLCLSLGWCFDRSPPQFSALGLAVGVGAARALTGLGVPGVALKWPNDVLAGGAKLGGILIEMQAQGGGFAHVVTGIGLNVSLPAGISEEVCAMGGLRPMDLATLMPDAVPERNAIAAALVTELTRVMKIYASHGLASFRSEWRALDCFADRHVQINTGRGRCAGIARGIDEDGALVLDTSAGPRRFVSGEASLRIA